MHWALWYHCSKDTLVFPGVAFPLNVLIVRVPNHSLAASMLRRWPNISSVWGGPEGCCAGLLGPHPPLEDHFPVIQYSINSSCRAMSLTQRWPKWGCCPSLLALSSWISSKTSLSWASLTSLRARWNCAQDSWGWLGDHFSTQNWHLGTRRTPAPRGHLFPYLCNCNWADTDLNGFIVPCHGQSENILHSQHLKARQECKNCIGIQKP